MFVYKEIKLKDLPKILARSSLTSGTCLILVGCATIFGRLLTIEQVPVLVAKAILGVSSNKVIVLSLINIFLFIVGMFMETLAAIIILAPLLLSIIKPLGVTPLHFGVIMIVNLVIGMCTPPVGVNLFVGSRLAGIRIEQTFKWLVPAVGVLLIVLMIVTYIPELSTFLPNILK
jgi:C4-dicarboxylate transporter DctM subunit